MRWGAQKGGGGGGGPLTRRMSCRHLGMMLYADFKCTTAEGCEGAYFADFLVDLSSVHALTVWILQRCKLKHAHSKRIDVHFLIVVLIIQLWSHVLRGT